MSHHTETEIRVMIAMHEQGFVPRDSMVAFLESRKKILKSIKDRLNMISGELGGSQKQDELIGVVDQWLIRLSQI